MRFVSRRIRFIWRYLRGDVPWDSGIVPPEIVAWVQAAEANSDAPGRALDLGCGTGTTSIFLAERGWQVIGVDFAPNAIWQARRKARQHNLDGVVSFHATNVIELGFVSPPIDLAVDIGCLHGLNPVHRVTYAGHLARLLRPGASYLLYAFLPRLSRDGTRQIGIDPPGVAALFGPALELVDHTLGREATADIGSAWYTLRRTEHPSP